MLIYLRGSVKPAPFDWKRKKRKLHTRNDNNRNRKKIRRSRCEDNSNHWNTETTRVANARRGHCYTTCSVNLRSIVLEADFYSRGSKLFMYVNPFAKILSNRETRVDWNFSIVLNTLNLLLHVTLFILHDPSLGCNRLVVHALITNL